MKQVRDISLHPNLILFIQNNSYFYLIKKIEQDRMGRYGCAPSHFTFS